MLDKLVIEGYKIFSAYKLNDIITGHYCDVCLDNGYNKYLHEIPLTSLKGSDFMRYIESVGVEEGDCNDFRHFFPRFLEILYLDIENWDGSDFGIFIWAILEKVDYTTWQENEKLLLIDFFKEYLKITGEPIDMPLNELSIDKINSVFKSIALHL